MELEGGNKHNNIKDHKLLESFVFLKVGIANNDEANISAYGKAEIGPIVITTFVNCSLWPIRHNGYLTVMFESKSTERHKISANAI